MACFMDERRASRAAFSTEGSYQLSTKPLNTVFGSELLREKGLFG